MSHPDREAIVDVDQVEAIEPAIRSSDPGRYHVDEIAADPLLERSYVEAVESRNQTARWDRYNRPGPLA
jgi:hypothetical protein